MVLASGRSRLLPEIFMSTCHARTLLCVELSLLLRCSHMLSTAIPGFALGYLSEQSI